MTSADITIALYRRVDEIVTGAIATVTVGGAILVTAAVIKAAILYLVP
jgi:hypothetical protein